MSSSSRRCCSGRLNGGRLLRLVLGALLLACAVLTASAPARAAGRAECRNAPTKILMHPVPYCVLLPPTYDASKTSRYPVLYYFHGLGGDEQTLVSGGGWDLIQDLWDRHEIGQFIIVAPAAGRSFYINSRDGKVRYEDFLLREFFPSIESHYRTLPGRRNRGVTGMSMGGYGALHVAFAHPELFGSVSAHSPALIAKLPRAQFDSEDSFGVMRLLGSAFGNPFDPAFWERNSPFSIVRDNPRPTGLAIYFDCGTEDDFGFYNGAKAFHDLLDSRHIPNEFHLYPGRHDWPYFAGHFPASLEFHSRAFGLATR
jgi:S-formylglutathione hydrolase FrmB